MLAAPKLILPRAALLGTVAILAVINKANKERHGIVRFLRANAGDGQSIRAGVVVNVRAISEFGGAGNSKGTC